MIHLSKKYVALALIGMPLTSHALEDNQQTQSQHIRQQSDMAITQQQQAIIDAATPVTPTSKLTSDPITPEKAIFMAINQQNWTLLTKALHDYEQKPNHNPTIVLFARANLAASQGKVTNAIKLYETILNQQPDFLRARLELARLYYQDGLLKESEQAFKTVLANKNLPASVITNIQAYLTVIHKKQSFNGTVAFGVGEERNLNETSESSTCLAALPNGECMYHRSTPKAINSAGLNLEATLNHDWQLKGHHGMTFSALAYGTNYLKNTANDFNNNTANISLGYRYNNASKNFILAPLVEYFREDNRKLYGATGFRSSYNQNLSQTQFGKWLKYPISLSLDTEYKDFTYRQDYANNNGKQWAVFGNIFMTNKPNNQWSLSLDYLNRDNANKPNAYEQKGIGVGNLHQWQNGVITNIALRYRQRDYDAYNALLQATRVDKSTILYTNIRVPKWQWQGFEPSFTYQYRHNNSNVNWLYDYNNSSIWFKLNKIF